MPAEDGHAQDTTGPAHPPGDVALVVARGRAEQALFGAARAAVRLGRYVVLEAIGAGAMGVVYAAYDPRLGRKIALKLLRVESGSLDDRLRLLREAQALAKLSHPNVVPIYDAGTFESPAVAAMLAESPGWSSEGEPAAAFIAMEFVEGETLGRWLTRRGRSWREVIAVLEQAGRGLAAAHAVGLVHRDFKPDNVMIGSDGRVRVMDFGLARTPTEPTPSVETTTVETTERPLEGRIALTSPGARLGTPAYMAPEQHLGRPVDARADQFGFCVTLWEALYGERPFAGATWVALTQMIVDGRIEQPVASLRRRVPDRLRVITMRGLAPDANDRWPDMGALLGALTFDAARRRRRWMLAAAVGATAIAVPTARASLDWRDRQACVSNSQRADEQWSTRRERVHGAIEASEVPFAADTWSRADSLLGGWADQWSALARDACLDGLSGATAATDAARQQTCLDGELRSFTTLIDELVSVDGERMRWVVPAVQSLSDSSRCRDPTWLAVQAGTDAETRRTPDADAIEEMLVQARTLASMGSLRPSYVIVLHALQRARVLGEPHTLVNALREAGVAAANAGEPNVGAALSLEAYYLAGRVGDHYRAAVAATDLVDTLGRELGQLDAGDAWLRQAATSVAGLGLSDSLLGARVMQATAGMALDRGAHETALSASREAVSRFESLLGAQHPRVASARRLLGSILHRVNREEEARSVYLQELELQRSSLGPDHPDLASTMVNIAHTLSRSRTDEAIAIYREAIAKLSISLGDTHPDTGLAFKGLGIALDFAGRLEEAEVELRRAMSIFSTTTGPTHPDLCATWYALAHVLQRRGDLAGAERAHTRALECFEAAAPRHPMIGLAIVGQGHIAFARGDFERALALHRRALTLLERAFGSDHAYTLRAQGDLAAVLRDVGNYDEAIAMLAEVSAGMQRRYGPSAPELVSPLVNLGNTHAAAGDTERAAEMLARAVAIAERTIPPGNGDRIYAFDSAAAVDLRRGRGAVAEVQFRRSIIETEAVAGTGAPDLAYALTGLGEALLASHFDHEARQVLERAMGLREHPDADPIELATTRFALARALFRTGDRRNALRVAAAAREGFAVVARGYPAEQRATVIAWLVRPS